MTPDAATAYSRYCELHDKETVWEVVENAIEAGRSGVTYHGFLPEDIVDDLRGSGYNVVCGIGASHIEYSINWA